MSSLKDLLASKQKDMASLAANGAGVQDSVLTSKEDAQQTSGMQGSAEAPKSLPTPAVISKEMNKEKAAKALAVYEDTRPLRRVVKSKGGHLKSIDGFFYATDDDEVSLLEDYASKGYCKLVQVAEGK